jgi:hypothetical protein
MKGMMCRFTLPRFLSPKDVREQLSGIPLYEDFLGTTVDLCPECATEFETFMLRLNPPAKDPREEDDNKKDSDAKGSEEDWFKAVFGNLFGWGEEDKQKDE